MMFAVAKAAPRPASEAPSDARTVTDPSNREFVSGVNRRPALPCADSDERAERNRRGAVLLEERPAGDASHLEVRHFGTVSRVPRHDQTGRGLRVDGGDCARDGWRIRHRRHRDARRDRAATKTAIRSGDRRLRAELTGRKTVRRRHEPQSRGALRGGDERSVGDRRHRIGQEQRPARDTGDLVVRHFGAVNRVAAEHEAARRQRILARRRVGDRRCIRRWRHGEQQRVAHRVGARCDRDGDVGRAECVGRRRDGERTRRPRSAHTQVRRVVRHEHRIRRCRRDRRHQARVAQLGT